MELKIYQAYTMAEALAAVKRDLGPDAVILSTRSFKRGGLLGLGRRTIVEITATTGRDDEPPPRDRGRSLPLRGGAARMAYAGKSARPQGLGGIETQGAADRTRTRRFAQALAEKHDRQPSPAPQTSVPAQRQELAPAPNPRKGRPSGPRPASPLGSPGLSRPHRAPAGRGSCVSMDKPKPLDEPGASASVARRFILTPAAETGEVEPARLHRPDAGPAASAVLSAAPPATGGAPGAVQDELVAIRQIVSQVLQRQVNPGRPGPDFPQALFDMYVRLLGQELSKELADRIVGAVRDELDAPDLEDEQTVREAVLRHLGELIPVAEPIGPERNPEGRPLTIVLIGPTGVGKTTTVAKLAATFKLRQGRKVGLITADTYRIAAVDQLRTYANIVGLPLQVVLTPAQMGQAVEFLCDRDVILIDTAGRGQNDGGRIDELKAFVAAADPHEVHLVLSSTASEKVLLQEAEAFGVVGVSKIVLTKLDEAVSFGMLVNVIRQVGKELSYITTGQEVPDHIEVGRGERMARLIMGGPVHA